MNTDVYRKALRLGLQHKLNNPAQASLPVLETLAPEGNRSGELALGLLEAPVSKVRGTAFAARGQAFAGNFMPILPPSTEFAHKWEALYKIHESEGIRDAVTALEYLGYYYVVEGNKRVSVLKYSGAYSVLCDVTRILPDWQSDDPGIAVFRDMFDIDNRFAVGHLWFSQPGRYPVLWDMARRQTRARGLPPEETASVLHEVFWNFRSHYHAMGLGTLPMTTGDAFYSFCEVYGFPPSRLPEEELKRRVRHMCAQWVLLSGPDPDAEKPVPPIAPVAKAKESLICLVEDTPSATAHTYALHTLMRCSGIASTCQSIPPTEEGYDALLASCRDARFDRVFVSGQTLAAHAWRLQIDCPDAFVALCTPRHNPNRLLNTYWGYTEQAAFLGGVLAGSLSRADRIAFAGNAENRRDVRFFAEGARLVNPRAHTLWFDGVPDASALLSMASEQADIVWLPSPCALPGVQRPFPGVWACLYALSPQGFLYDCLGGAVWNWEVLYARMALAAQAGAAPRNWRLGLAERLLDFIALAPSLTPHSLTLLQSMRKLFDLSQPPCSSFPGAPPAYITILRRADDS